jgi:threonine aldolase
MIPSSKSKLKYIRKQCAQLPSKTRFIACQFERYFANQLYLQIAKNSCAMAQKLFEELQKIPQVKVTAKRQSNAVFAEIPRPWVKSLKEKYFFYVWNESTFECRLMASWDTEATEVDGFISQLRQLSETIKI